MATIVAAAGGGNWTTGGTWVGGTAPTAADDAQLTNTSGAVTIDSGAVCRSLDCTGYTGVLTHTSAVTLTIGDGTAGAGNIALKLVAGMTYTPSANTMVIKFASTSTTQQTVDFGGKNPGNVTFDGVAGKWALTTGFSTRASTTTVTLTNGTLQTDGVSDNSGLTHTWGLLSTTNSNTRVLTLGNSTINLSNTAGGNSLAINNAAGLTLNKGTSTINITGSNGGVDLASSGGGTTPSLYNLAWTAGGQVQLSLGGATVTFNNLTFTGASVKTDIFTIQSNRAVTVTGALNITGQSAINRVLFQPQQLFTTGLQTTVTVTGASVTLSNTDVRSIAFVSTTNLDFSTMANPIGDCGGNTISGGGTLTFTAGQDHYWVGNTGNWSATSSWSTSSGGASGARVPLPQDNIYFDNGSFNGTGQTATLDMPRAGKNIDWSGYNEGQTPAWAKTTATTMYGSLTMIAGMTNSGTATFINETRANSTWTNATQTWTNPTRLQLVGGTITMQDAFKSTSTFELDRSFNFSTNYNMEMTTFTMNRNDSGATLTMGSGTWTLTGTGTVWNISTTNLTFSANTATIKITDTTNTAITFAGGGATAYNNLWFSRGASTASNTISGSNTFVDFKDTGTAAHSILFTAGTTQTVTTFTVSGSSGNVITLNSTTTATFALTKSGSGIISRDYLNIQHSVVSPSTSTWYAGNNSVNNQGVATAGSGWIFTGPPGGNFFLFFR